MDLVVVLSQSSPNPSMRHSEGCETADGVPVKTGVLSQGTGFCSTPQRRLEPWGSRRRCWLGVQLRLMLARGLEEEKGILCYLDGEDGDMGLMDEGG